jgi:CubicO group peptidase (beta-lactamase class C family)
MSKGASLPRSTPEAQGVDSAAIGRLVTALVDGDYGTHGLVVVRHGHVIAESWWSPYRADQPHVMFSVSKSFTATAVGIAETEGLLSVDEPILSVFPNLASERARANMGNVRIKDLLAMASGHEADTVGVLRALPHEDWLRLFLEIPVAYPPGEHFVYNSGGSFALAAAVASRTGQSVLDYLRPRLLEPLGIEVDHWEQNSRGQELGWTGLRLTTEDLAKFGLLYLQGGMWNGVRLLSEDWVRKATALQVDNSTDGEGDWGTGYGYQWWRSRHDSFRADGAFGQFSLVYPEADVVVAITAGDDRGREVPQLVWENLVQHIAEEPLPAATPAVAENLNATLAATALPWPRFVPADPELSTRISGRHIDLPFSVLGIDGIRLDFTSESIDLTVDKVSGEPETYRGGRNEWLDGYSSIFVYEEINGARTASAAGWVDDATLEFHQQCVETPFMRLWRISFEDEKHPLVSTRLVPGPWIDREEKLRGTLAG